VSKPSPVLNTELEYVYSIETEGTAVVEGAEILTFSRSKNV